MSHGESNAYRHYPPQKSQTEELGELSKSWSCKVGHDRFVLPFVRSSLYDVIVTVMNKTTPNFGINSRGSVGGS